MWGLALWGLVLLAVAGGLWSAVSRLRQGRRGEVGQTDQRRRGLRGRGRRTNTPAEPYVPRHNTDPTIGAPGRGDDLGTDQTGAAQTGAAQTGAAQSGSQSGAEQVVLGTFRDHRRGRVVPFKMYMPALPDPQRVPEAGAQAGSDPAGSVPSDLSPAPVVIFSHGLGGSRDAASYLGHALARAGYFGFFIQHPGTDSSMLEGIDTPQEIQKRLAMAIKVPGNMLDRFSDLPFVLDELERMNTTTKLAGRLDLHRIGMIGHSYGARGTMAAAGQAFGAYGTRFKDPRIKVGVPLSPNVTVPRGQSLAGIYDGIDIPLLHVTGSGDGMMGDEDFDPYTRTIPYQTITAPDQYLLVLDGASHSTFSGRVDDGDGGEVQDVIALLVVLFLNAHLRGDVAAWDELHEDFAYRLAPEDIFEFK